LRQYDSYVTNYDRSIVVLSENYDRPRFREFVEVQRALLGERRMRRLERC